MWTDIIFSIVLSLIITFVFAVGFKNKGPWGAIWAFFLLIFLAVWAGSIWVNPAGVEVWGYPIIPVAIIGVVCALIISATAPPDSRETIRHHEELGTNPKKGLSMNSFSVYFWLVMVTLVLIIVFGYYVGMR